MRGTDKYLFRSPLTFTLWLLAGLLCCALTWVAMIGVWLWLTR